jgi:hypothetical protein
MKRTNRVVPARLLVALLIVIPTAVCSQVTDDPSDCLADQYYDDGRELCRTCAPAVLPACPLDCGYVLITDRLGCQVSECVCGVCEADQFFDRDLLACTECPAASSAQCREGCPIVGQTADEQGCSQAVCECEQDLCPPVPPVDCGDDGCCEAVTTTGDDGCTTLGCQCPEEAPLGYYFDDTGVCRTCDGLDEPPAQCLSE